jgi:hypothetical protein
MSYELMAAQHVETLRAFRPKGPYLLGGTCNGGLVAFEMARQLVEDRQQVDLLVLIGSSAENIRFRLMKQTIAAAGETLRFPPRFQMALYELMRRIALALSDRPPPRGAVTQLLAKVRKPPRELIHVFRSAKLRASGKTSAPGTDAGGETPREQRNNLRETYLRIDRHYIPGKYANTVTLLWPQDDPGRAEEAARWWAKVAAQVELHVVPGTHLGSLTEDVKGLAEYLKRCLG